MGQAVLDCLLSAHWNIDILWEYRERTIVAEHLGFCENCWSTHYIKTVNGRKVKREFEEMAFIDLAGKHGVVPSSADRIYCGAIDKLRKALEEDIWL